jgi:seryl-tRNA synthetase
MAGNAKLNAAAKKIGAAAGRADRKAHKVAAAAKVARKELTALNKRLDVLARDLKRATKRVQAALD